MCAMIGTDVCTINKVAEKQLSAPWPGCAISAHVRSLDAGAGLHSDTIPAMKKKSASPARPAKRSWSSFKWAFDNQDLNGALFCYGRLEEHEHRTAVIASLSDPMVKDLIANARLAAKLSKVEVKDAVAAIIHEALRQFLVVLGGINAVPRKADLELPKLLKAAGV